MATWPNLHVSQHPAVRHKLAILRDQRTEPKKFREVVRELSWLLGYEALADARVRELDVKTPLETMPGWMQAIAAFNPVAHATEALRGAVLGTGTVMDTATALAAATVLWVVVTVVPDK